jgi:integrase/recombinase XerC
MNHPPITVGFCVYTMDELIVEFMDYLTYEKRYGRNTLCAYQHDVGAFIAWVASHHGQVSVSAIHHPMTRGWLKDLAAQGMTAKTLQRKISTLRTFFKYLMRRGKIDHSPMDNVLWPRCEKKLPHFIAANDMRILFDHVEFPDTWQGRTQHLMMLIMYQTGVRCQEVIELKERDVCPNKKVIKIVGKGNKERIVPIGQDLCDMIMEYIREKPDCAKRNFHLLITEKCKPLATRTVYQVVHKYLSLVTTVEKRSPHIIRHTFATHLANNGANLNAIKDLLGHTSLASTQVYLHSTFDKLKAIHQKAHPKG